MEPPTLKALKTSHRNKARDLPLLFKGEDFAMTDIRSAL
jgi:uncharacterized protein with PIN domain